MSLALAARRSAAGALPRAAMLSVLVLAAAAARAALNGQTVAEAFGAGTAFGLVLFALALWAGWRPRRPRVRGVAAGAVVGVTGAAVLVAIPVLVRGGLPLPAGIRPEPILVWVAATVLVASAEEAVLRGALFDQLVSFGGPIAAVAATSLLFGIIHVPLYGWSVLPLDVAAGTWLAGLRLASGGVLAPTIAHVLADLATWWL